MPAEQAAALAGAGRERPIEYLYSSVARATHAAAMAPAPRSLTERELH